jgi:NADPH:quinone reductase-like Zn-dependent oxidoreductase
MKAIRVHEYGGTDRLTYEEVPRPDPAADELLVAVRAAGVNPIDWMVREGYADDALDPSLPYVPGWDVSGVVQAVGVDVDRFAPGDAVFGLVAMPDPGETYAEYATVPASDVVRKPASLAHAAAASLPMAALTARRALVDEAGVEADDRVLVHAAAGGVGHLAVQFATHLGARVVGTASARNREYLRRLGADRVIDYTEQRFEDAVDAVDVVLDGVGGETLDRSVAVLAEGGRLVTLPRPPSETVVERARRERDATVSWFSVEPDAAALRRVRDLVTEGVVAPTVSDRFPLAEARAAHERSETGHVRGKLVLTVAEGTGG